MELAPDDDMKGLLGIEPANAEEVRLPPAVAVPAVSAATAHATASDERRRDMQRTSTTERRCLFRYGRVGPNVGTGMVDCDGLGCGSTPPPPLLVLADGLGDGLGLVAG